MYLTHLRASVAIALAMSSVLAGAQGNSTQPSDADQTPQSSALTVLPSKTGVWTYPGTGTVHTYWIETPSGRLVVIDVQRDLVHAAQALAAVKAVGKPVRPILVTHAHPDHYTGLGLFR